MITNSIRQLRKDKGITQTELADAVLSTRQTIYLLEKNKVVPSLELAFKLAEYFEVHVEDVFSYEKKKVSVDDDLFNIF